MGKFIDETGHVYGKLTVLRKADKKAANGSIKWVC